MTTSLRRIWIAAGLITALVIVIVALLPKSNRFIVAELRRPAPDSFASTLLQTGASWLTQTTCNLFTNN